MNDLSKIKHVVVLMLENRSFDHVFGGYRAEGKTIDAADPDRYTNSDREGALHEVNELGDELAGVFKPDPHHGWQAVEKQLARENSGFVIDWVDSYRNQASPRDAVMGYLNRKHQPVSYFFADEYMVLERYFASIPTDTLPNRFYSLCGDSAGHRENALRRMLITQMEPIFSHLPKDQWRVYAGALPTIAMAGGIAEKRRNLANIRRLTRFFNDAANGDLPRLTWIEPVYSWSDAFLARLFGVPVGPPNDDHPPSHTARGQKLLHDVYSVLVQDAARWQDTLLIVNYDEHGGFADHVPPPMLHPQDVRSDGFTNLGPRVPAWLISPYAQREGRSKVQFEHCSVLKFIADWFGVPGVGRARSPRMNSIAAALLENRRPEPCPPAPQPPPQPMAPAPGTEAPADDFEQAAVAYVDRIEEEEPEVYDLLREKLQEP